MFLKLSLFITVTASGFLMSEPSLAKTLLKLTPIETVSPISSLILFLISSAIKYPSPPCFLESVTSSQASSIPKGST